MAQVFRKSSVEQAATPDQLDAYISAATPTVWVVLAAIIALIVGGVAWASVGSIRERAQAIVVVEGGEATAYVGESNAEALAQGQTVNVTATVSGESSNAEGTLASATGDPVSSSDLQSLLGEKTVSDALGSPTWAVAVPVEAQLADGVYTAEIITATYSPLQLLLGAA